MTKPKTIEILTAFNKWRRGDNIPHPAPGPIGEAIDTAIKHLKQSVKAGKLKKARAMRAKQSK